MSTRLAVAIVLLTRIASADVITTIDDRQITMDNGTIALQVSRALGTITSIQYRKDGQTHTIASGPEGMYWDANAEVLDVPIQPDERPPNKGYYRPGNGRESVELLTSTPRRAEVVVKARPTRWFAFSVEYHFILFADDAGYYSYVIFRHPEDQPAARLWQTRFVHKLVLRDQLTTHVVDDQQIQPINLSPVTTQVMDATFQLEDGSVKTKYAQSVYWHKAMVYGFAGDKIGVWSISASPEYHNGGPVKQGQTLHDNVLLRVMQSSHFGAAGVDIARGEKWEKIYGPVFTYVNSGSSVAEMWADAKARQAAEAAKWPYEWVDQPQYIKQRGSVRGQWKLTTGPAARGAWAILAEPGGDWPGQGRRCTFWTETGPDGNFTIDKVIPGVYTLYIVGADQPQQFARDGIEIVADKLTDLGAIEWTPISHGRTLWQIGTFDRTAAEFRNGDDPRHFEMFRRYPADFPDDVTFVIGQSDPRKDWNYAHWTWFSRNPQWKIAFNLPQPISGRATLTVGVASAQPLHGDRTDLRIAVNGRQIGALRLPKTGTAGYRGSAQDSPYNVEVIEFDAALLSAGRNEVTLAHAHAEPFPATTQPVDMTVGQVMYDALRLEISQ